MPMTTTARVSFTNYREPKAPFTLWVEPWGEDYTLLPGDTLEVVAAGFTTESYFSIVHADHEGDLLLYIEGPCDAWTVYDGETAVYCAHNREHQRPR